MSRPSYDLELSVCERCGNVAKIRFPRIYEVHGKRVNGLVCPKCRDEIDWKGVKRDAR